MECVKKFIERRVGFGGGKREIRVRMEESKMKKILHRPTYEGPAQTVSC